jgi:hypothetical protein
VLGWLGLGPGVLPAQESKPPSPPPPPALQVGDPAYRSDAQVTVRNTFLRCFADSELASDVVLSTVGTEFEQSGETGFTPVLSLALEREMHGGEGLEWMALWNLGKQPTGFWANFRAVFPLSARKPVEPPARKVRLWEELESGQADWGSLQAPEPDLDAVRLGRPSPTGLIHAGLRRAFGWMGLYGPAHFLFRSWQARRRDLRDRRFQETYQGLQWYLDAVDSTGLEIPQPTMAAIKFHLVRDLSALAPFVSTREFRESAWSYDSVRRQRNLAVSSTLMTAANEYGLGYEELYQPLVNGTRMPVGGILYYDPTHAPAAGQQRWNSPNLFDLRYNVFADPRVQGLAEQYPNQPIPVALYSYYPALPRKPIILVDFFDADNPRSREAAAVRMGHLADLLQTAQWSLPYWALYQPVTYIATKKAFTPLANRQPAMGLEEFRFLLRNHLLFKPELSETLLREVDKRELNPLMPAGATQQLNAQIHYELLRATQGEKTCRQVADVQQRLYRKLSGRKIETLDRAERLELGGWLEQRRALEELSRLSGSRLPWERLHQESEPALERLGTARLAPRLPARKVLLGFYRRLFEEQQRFEPTMPESFESTTTDVEAILARVYEAEERSPQLAQDLQELKGKVLAERERADARQVQKRKKEFEKKIQRQLEWLAKLNSKKDLLAVSAWRIERALEFLTGAPSAAAQDPHLQPILERYQRRMAKARASTAALLQQLSYQEELIEGARLRCLALLGWEVQPLVTATSPSPRTPGGARPTPGP